MRVRFAIIGAGPTGIGAAYRLTELSEPDFAVFERENRIGGLACSIKDSEGFTWDIGGHVHFSSFPIFNRAVDDALGPDGWNTHERGAFVWIDGRFVAYPLQQHLHSLPKDAMWRCVKGLLARARHDSGRSMNFRDWLVAKYREGLSDYFLIPYNLKVWAYPLELLSSEWISDRVADVDLVKTVEAILFGVSPESWGPNQRFRYPKHGGTGMIWEKMAGAIGRHKFVLGANVSRIHPSKRRLFLSSGETVDYDYLFNTMPLDELSGLIAGCPTHLRQDAHALRYCTTHVVGIGMSGSAPSFLAGKHWIYFPQKELPFHRLTLLSSYSRSVIPDDRHWSVLLEINESGFKAVRNADLVAESCKALRELGWLDESTPIASTFRHTAQRGYPIPTIERNALLDRLLPALERLGIYSRGRFGAWTYEVSNQDHSFMQGVEWVDRIINAGTETVLRRFPHL